MSGPGGEGKKAPLDTLSKEELITKCKNLLQLAQKAKQAKDDLARKYESQQEILEKEKEKHGSDSERIKELESRNQLLDSQREDLEDLLKSKQRKLERQNDENDSLLQQVQTYNTETKNAKSKIEEQDQAIIEMKKKIAELEKKASKSMELEANIICSKEAEKKLQKEIVDLKKRSKDLEEKKDLIEEALNIEKKLSADKNTQIKALHEKVESLQTCVQSKNDEDNSILKNDIREKNEKLDELESKIKSMEEIEKDHVEKVQALHTEKDELSHKLDETHINFVKCEKEKACLVVTNEELLKELNDCNLEMRRRGEKIADMEEKLQQVSQMEQTKDEYSLKCSDLTKELQEVHKKMNCIQDEKWKLDDCLGKTETQLEEQKEQMLEKDSMIDSQKKEIESLDFELTKCRENIEKLNQAATNTSANYDEKLKTEREAMSKEFDEMKDRLKMAKLENNSFQLKLQDLQKDKNSLDDLLIVREKEISEYKDKLKDFELKNDSMITGKEYVLATEKLKETEKYLEESKAQIIDMEEKLKEMTSELDGNEYKKKLKDKELVSDNQDLIKKNDELVKTISTFEAEKLKMMEMIEVLKKEVLCLSESLNNRNEEFSRSVSDKDRNEGLIADLESKNIKLSSTITDLKSHVEEISRLMQMKEEEKDNLQKEIEKNLTEAQGLSSKIQSLNDAMKQKDYEIQSLNTNASDVAMQAKIKVGECEALSKKVKELTLSVKAKNDNLEKLSKTKADLESNLAEKSSSLETMGQVCQRLKLDIEKKAQDLEAANKKCIELGKELDTFKSRPSVDSNKNDSFNASQCSVKTSVFDNSRTMSEHDDSRSEVMSTSTISRAEDFNRMRDLEDSFEERYSKLKLVAIKLKKKVGDQAKIIEEFEKSSKGKVAESNNGALKDKLATMTKNFNNLQLEYDQGVDKIDELEKKVKTLTKDLETVMNESINNKQNAMEANQNCQVANNENSKALEKLKEHENELSNLKIVLDQERKERKSIEITLKSIEHTENESTEKSNQIKIHEETIDTLKQQVAHLEDILEKEQERADRAQTSLTTTRSQLNEAETELVKRKGETQELKTKYEETLSLFEETKEELSTVLSRSEKSESLDKNRLLQLERQLGAVENRLQGKSNELKEKDSELGKLRREFDGYKVRAQSVLKQSKEAAEVEDKKKNQEELNAMEKINEALNEKLKSVAGELKTMDMEKRSLQDEHERLMERQSLLLQELAGKEKTWRSKFDGLEKKLKEFESEKEQSSENVAKIVEEMRQKHIQELEMMRTNHNQETVRLKTQVDVAENEIIRLEFVLQKEQEARKYAEEMVGSQPQLERERLDISQIEREAAEGQEVEPVFPGGLVHSSPLPLEQLLATPEPQGYQDREGSRSAASSRQGGADRQLAHLSALLAESEAQNGRLEKLTEVLKEEIRTYQRSEERHKHIENLEYVKNVILKFLSLGGEERARLIPVLSTILRLSKEEIAQIQQLAKVEEEAASSEGWSSYLHLWSAP